MAHDRHRACESRHGARYCRRSCRRNGGILLPWGRETRASPVFSFRFGVPRIGAGRSGAPPMIAPLRKAVFPVAGLGVRLLPATRAIPKEMLMVVDRPVIDYVVEEARAAGIEHFILVTGRNKAVIE